MTELSEIKISKQQIVSALEKIPEADFIDKQYDEESAHEPKGLFFLISTPRSGSTLVCDLLYQSGFCLAHEYFQPYEYLPALANRWNCLHNGKLDKARYTQQLVRYRTLQSGWLGINLHGEHLPTFSKFSEHFPNRKRIFLRIRRRDIIAQAVSYEIAIQTGAWSSQFSTKATPVYSFERINQRISSIKHQNLLADTYLASAKEKPINVIYEDFIENQRAGLETIIPEEFHDQLVIEPTVRKQASNINKAWISRFSQEFFETGGKGYTPKKHHPLFLKRNFLKILTPTKC